MDIEFLLEIGCEEIPARFIETTLLNLRSKFEDLFQSNALNISGMELFSTPRRLIVHVEKLSSSQQSRTELVTGPPASAAFDASGNPTKAAEGFALKCGVPLSQLQKIQTEKGNYLGYERTIEGKTTRQILSAAMPEILRKLEFPKNMKWEPSQFLFARPVRWILCLLGGEVVPFEIAGVAAGNFTYGHRILSKDIKLEVSDYEVYKSITLNNHIIYEQSKRREIITELLNQTAAKHDGELIADETLLNTVVYLNESPSVVFGSFDPAYLSIPREVLITVMREHQKYFSIQDRSGQLMPNFLAVVDSTPEHHPLIVQGHERVLRARLADAKFFWEVDNKVPLINRVDKLRGIVFQAKLGTLDQKAHRVEKLAETIAKYLNKKEIVGSLKQAAALAKTDLTTDMVKEFTDLQGIMGGLYARKQNLPVAVSNAIYDHYKPLSFDGESPRTIEGAVLAIADKLDSVVGAFSIGLIPTGSRDPLALRRQTLGIIKILLDHRLSFSFDRMVSKSYSSFRKLAERSLEETIENINVFIKERLVFVFKEKGYKYDEVNAVVEVDFDDPLDCQARIQALSEMRSSEDFLALAISFKRIKNIVAKAGLNPEMAFDVDESLLVEPEEKELYNAVAKLKPQLERKRRQHHYRSAFESMAFLRLTVDRFFDKVLVMAEDAALQKNRLNLLGGMWKLFLELADISEIVVVK